MRRHPPRQNSPSRYSHGLSGMDSKQKRGFRGHPTDIIGTHQRKIHDAGYNKTHKEEAFMSKVERTFFIGGDTRSIRNRLLNDIIKISPCCRRATHHGQLWGNYCFPAPFFLQISSAATTTTAAAIPPSTI